MFHTKDLGNIFTGPFSSSRLLELWSLLSTLEAARSADSQRDLGGLVEVARKLKIRVHGSKGKGSLWMTIDEVSELNEESHSKALPQLLTAIEPGNTTR